MQRVQAFEKLLNDGNDVVDRRTVSLEPGTKRLAPHVLHGDERLFLPGPHVVDARQSFVLGADRGTCFAKQTPFVGITLLAGRSKNLESDQPIEKHVAREKNVAHASVADGFDDAVAGGPQLFGRRCGVMRERFGEPTQGLHFGRPEGCIVVAVRSVAHGLLGGTSFRRRDPDADSPKALAKARRLTGDRLGIMRIFFEKREGYFLPSKASLHPHHQ
jgi:hypothetical protein